MNDDGGDDDDDDGGDDDDDDDDDEICLLLSSSFFFLLLHLPHTPALSPWIVFCLLPCFFLHECRACCPWLPVA
jgi:hypothetical protein